MKKKTLIIGVVVATLGTAALGAASFAGRDRDKSHFHGMGAWGHHGGGMHGGSFMGGSHRGAMMGKMMKMVDADGDGKVTQAEIDAAIETGLARFDTDQNGELALEEFAALWADFMRERMVDHFQVLDADGNAQVTLEEFQDPFSRAVERYDRDGDGAISRQDYGHRRHHRDDNDD